MTLNRQAKSSILLLLLLVASTGCGRPSLHPRSPANVDSSDLAGASPQLMETSEATANEDQYSEEDGEIDDNDEDPQFLWDEHSSQGANWTAVTFEAIEAYGQELVSSNPADIAAFCPKYKSLDQSGRSAFWVQLISAVAFKESRFKSKKVYLEKFKNSKDENVRSRGLLQISLESSNGYGCGFKKETDIDRPEKNLTCGVKIMSRWVERDGVISGSKKVRVKGKPKTIWLGGARYWSVLRSKDKLKSIREFTNSFELCK